MKTRSPFWNGAAASMVRRMLSSGQTNPPTPTPSTALFGNAQRTAKNWAILYKNNHWKTWTYLKKKMLTHYCNMQYSMSLMDAMLGTCPRTDTPDNLEAFTADCVDAFKVQSGTRNLAQARCPTRWQLHCGSVQQLIHYNVLDQICTAFMVHLLPPDIRSKVFFKYGPTRPLLFIFHCKAFYNNDT